MVPSLGGVPIANAPRPAWQNVPLYIQGASASLPQHANIHAHLAASASQTLPKAGQPPLQSRAASAPVQPNLNLNFQIAGLLPLTGVPAGHSIKSVALLPTLCLRMPCLDSLSPRALDGEIGACMCLVLVVVCF